MSAVICGPMLRHASPEVVYIWLVLDSKPNTIDAQVIRDDGKVVGRVTPQSLNAIQAGKQLFFYRLALAPVKVSGEADRDVSLFLADTLFHYDIVIDGQNLAAQGFLNGERYIGLTEGENPSFFLPAMQTNILQASCRRPHATVDGEQNVPDQIIDACKRVQADGNDLAKRPSQLFLTGDQIYADDVALPMGLLCSKLASDLVGDESMPNPESGELNVVPSDVALLTRDQYIHSENGFTTTEQKLHLMGFGEYVAMHMMTWGSDTVGVKDLPTYEEIQSSIPQKKITRGPRAKKVLKPIYSESDYQVDCKIIGRFLSGTHYARRLMANVPTYMMFDDHEITDDWNLTKDIHQQLNTNPFSRRLVTNGLTAYWLCQHWGNVPEIIAEEDVRKISDCFVQKNEAVFAEFEQKVLSRYWAYNVPTNPPVLVLDTRTKRHFSKQGLALISPQGFALLRELVDALKSLEPATLVLLSPTPVYGFSSLESLQLGVPGDAATVFDSEPWIANEFSMALLKHELAALHELKHVVILSGDVHYSFGRLDRDVSTVEGRAIDYYQLCSSPSCNIAPGHAIGQWVLEHVLDWDVFHKKHTQYLLPDIHCGESVEDVGDSTAFITSDTNVEMVRFGFDAQGSVCPKSAVLYCADKDRGSYEWHYDLAKPNLYVIGVGKKNYSDAVLA